MAQQTHEGIRQLMDELEVDEEVRDDVEGYLVMDQLLSAQVTLLGFLDAQVDTQAITAKEAEGYYQRLGISSDARSTIRQHVNSPFNGGHDNDN